MKIYALYDANCTLCQESKRIFQKIDRKTKVNWLSLQEYEKTDQEYSFSAIELRRELHIILPDKRVLKGFEAVRKLLLISPYTFLIGSFLHIPYMHVIGRPIYGWIAKRRHQFKAHKCSDDSCSL